MQSFLNNDFVNDMDDTITGKHISCDNIWGTAVVFDLNTAATLLKGDLLSAKGGDSAIPHFSGRNQGADNMAGKIITRSGQIEYGNRA